MSLNQTPRPPARELRDRYLEEMNSGHFLSEGSGKYDVSRAAISDERSAITGIAPTNLDQTPLLKAA